MKNFLRKCVLYALKRMAKRKLRKFNGKVIAVTGSIGKTSTKEAIFKALNTQFRVKRSRKSMNSDFGILLTILDIESGFSSATKWMWYLTKAFWNSWNKDHSEVLLLEMGVDKPGDMDFLLSIITPDIAVFTNVFPNHMAEGQFSSMQEIFDEKSKLVCAVKEGGIVLLNVDDPFVETMSKKCPKRRVLTYGSAKEAVYRMGSVNSSLEGIKFSLFNKDRRIVLEAPLLGEYQAYVLAPAYICAELLGMESELILEAIGRYKLPPGRLSVIDGRDGVTILDSSYNSSPAALKEALKVLDDLAEKKNRRVAVLGMMNELGEASIDLHKAVGAIVPKYADVLISVGSDAKYFAESAVAKRMDEKAVHHFANAKEAIAFYKEDMKDGDLILVKGSQNRVRLERFVKEFMLHPEDAKELLVRQEKEWMAKL